MEETVTIPKKELDNLLKMTSDWILKYLDQKSQVVALEKELRTLKDGDRA
jgi:hypothetical protein